MTNGVDAELRKLDGFRLIHFARRGSGSARGRGARSEIRTARAIADVAFLRAAAPAFATDEREVAVS